MRSRAKRRDRLHNDIRPVHRGLIFLSFSFFLSFSSSFLWSFPRLSFRFFAPLCSIWVSAFFLYFTSFRVFSLRRSEFFRVCRFVPISRQQSKILPILDTFFVVNATFPSNKRHDFHPLCNSRLRGSGGSYPPPFLRQPTFTPSRPFIPTPSRSPFAPHN